MAADNRTQGIFRRVSVIWQLATIASDTGTDQGRARERHRRLLLSAATAACARAITIGTGLVTVPLTLNYLGSEQYGMWMVLSSLTVMLSFADMGLGNGILNVIAREHGKNDRRAIREAISSGYAMLLVVALIVLAAFTILYSFVPWYQVFNVRSPEARAAAAPALATFIVCFAIAIPMNVVQKVQIGLQQGYRNSIWQALGSIAALVAVLIVIWSHGSLPFLVGALVGAPLLTGLLNTATFFVGEGRDVRPSPSYVTYMGMRSTGRTGGMFFLLQIVGSVAFGADTIIVAQIAGAAVVAEYAVPERLFALVSIVVSMALAPLWPAYGEAISRGDHVWVRQTFKRSLLAAVAVSAVASFGLVVLGRPLIHLWVGDVVSPSIALLIGLGLWRVVEAVANAVAYYMTGANELKYQLLVGFFIAFVKIPAKVGLVYLIGPAGIPWGAIVGFIIAGFIPYYVFLRKTIFNGGVV